MEEKIKEIVTHFGVRNQLKKISEEVFELQESCIEKNKMHIEEEIADVFVLLEQIIIAYDLDEENINDNMSFKIERTIKRIKDGYYDR